MYRSHVLKRHYLLCCDLGRMGEPPITGVRTAWVEKPADERFEQMLALAGEQGLDEQWCVGQLTAGDACVLAMDGERAGGMGLLSYRELWVEEIAQSFSPQADGCYLYATYVSPPYRGRRIQRLLDGERMCRAAGAGRRWAYAIVEAENEASLRGHQAGGFCAAARMDVLQWRGIRVSSVRRLSPSRPGGRFEGVRLGPIRNLSVKGWPVRFAARVFSKANAFGSGNSAADALVGGSLVSGMLRLRR